MTRLDHHHEGIAERAYAATCAVDRFYAEQAANEAREITLRLVAGDGAETIAIADEFQGGATNISALVSAWAHKDKTAMLRLLDKAMTAAVRDVATHRAEQRNP